MPAPTVLPGRAYQQVDRRSRLLFSWRADSLDLKTVGSYSTGTFARASQGGVVPVGYGPTGPGGIGVNPVDGVPHLEWVDTTGDGTTDAPALLLQAAATNLMGTKDLNSWNKQGTITVTGITGPDGKTSAFRLNDDSNSSEYIWLAIPFTGDGVKSLKVAVKERGTFPTRAPQTLVLRDDSVGTDRAKVTISSWVSGEPQAAATTGTLLAQYPIGDSGWWVLDIQSTSVTAANTHKWRIRPTSNSLDTGQLDVWLPSAYNNPTPPHSMLDASVALAADSLYWAFNAPLKVENEGQPWTVYAQFICHMLANQGSTAIALALGNVGAAGSALEIGAQSGAAYWHIRTRGTAGGIASTNLTSAAPPAMGSLFEVRASVPATGNVTVGVSKASASEVTQAHTPGVWDSAFNLARINLGMDGAGASQATMAALRLKVAHGERSMDYMREAY